MARKKQTNWDRYLAEQMADSKFKALVEKELADLQIGIEIAKLRQTRGLSQTELAVLVGTSGPDISRLERGNANPTLRTLSKIASALGAKLEVRFHTAR